MNELNVKNFGLRGKDAKRRLAKYKKQRIVRGFSDYDAWDLDCFLARLIANSIHHLADTGMSWNPTYGDTPDDYRKYLHSLADKFDNLLHFKDETDIVNFKEHDEQLHKLTKEAFNELGEIFWTLWD